MITQTGIGVEAAAFAGWSQTTPAVRQGVFLEAADVIESRQDEVVEALAQAIEAGIVHVDDQTVGDEPQMPVGGVTDRGFGRFGGTAIVDEFTEAHWVTVQRGSRPFPF